MAENKKQYETPKVVIHGDIRSITQGGIGDASDGGFGRERTQTGSL